MKLDTAIKLYCEETTTRADKGSSIINQPDVLVTPKLRDLARRRLVKTNPDIDADALTSQQQSDNAAFTGKKYRVQDTKYGHYISEHDDEEEAKKAALARPYSRVLSHPEWQHVQRVRDMVRRRIKENSKI